MKNGGNDEKISTARFPTHTRTQQASLSQPNSSEKLYFLSETILLDFLEANVTQRKLEQSLKQLEKPGLLDTKPSLNISSPSFKKEIQEKLFKGTKVIREV